MNFFILFLGVVFCSTSIIFIKKSQIESEYLSAYRTLLSAFLLLPICFYDIRKNPDIKVISYIKVAFIPGLLLSLHFISWIYGARMAEPANSSLIVNLTPLVTPIFLYIIIREKLTFREVLGTTIVMTGVGILAFHDFKESKEYFIGDIICLFSMVFFSIYLIFSRKNKTLTSLWLYVTCLYAWCGLICFCVGLCMQKNPIANIDSNNLLQVFFLSFFYNNSWSLLIKLCHETYSRTIG